MNNRFKNPTTTVRICGSDRGFMAISRLNADNTSTQGPGRRQSLLCLGAYSNLLNCQANRRRQRKVWSRSWRRTTDHFCDEESKRSQYRTLRNSTVDGEHRGPIGIHFDKLLSTEQVRYNLEDL
uniref:uncharacterized protein LOC120344646 n=1 Tax=Styela clava TaxID=7725 RepID=UPI00193AA5A4|nr:uncharacterized protein LOC120344646 [Styela clava]